MFPTGDDPSAAAAAAAAAMSFPDADADADDDSEGVGFTGDPLVDPSDPGFPNRTSSSATALAPSGSAGGSGGERRPLFQRLWTEEDEIVILRGFAEFTAARGTAFASHQYDTDPFYEDMRRRLQLDFSKSQLVEKLRRLKRKYRNCVSRLRGSSGNTFSFRSPHEQAIFEIARNIWRPANKHGREADSDEEDAAAAAAATTTPTTVIAVNAITNGEVKSPTTSGRQRRRRRTADTATNMVQPLQPVQVKMEDSLPALPQTPMPAALVTLDGSEPHGFPAMPTHSAVIDAEKSCLTPLFKEMVHAVINIGSNPFGALLPELPHGLPMEGEKWRNQRISELEVYLKRIELLKDQVTATLEELKSSTPGT